MTVGTSASPPHDDARVKNCYSGSPAFASPA